MNSLNGKVAIVTGASRGIGRKVSLALAREGAHVVVTARTEKDLDTLVREISQAGGNATALMGDASLESDVERVYEKAMEITGSIDILVNNAGIGILGNIDEISIEDFDKQVAINIRSVFLFTRLVVPVLRSNGGGNIVNIASISGLVGFSGASIYVATKFATVGMSRAWDKELRKDNIKVTAICPAGVETDWAMGSGLSKEMVAGANRIDPATIAETVLFAIKQPKNTRVTELVVYPMSEEGHQ